MGTVARKLQAVLDSKAAIKAAIEGKGVADVGDVLSAYAGKIESIQTGGWTGHADEAGLKAIGWTDEDIAYYQKYGVNWDEEDDELHKVPQDNIDLYGVLTASNIQTYKDRIVYLPKIDTTNRTSMSNLFQDCKYLVAIPLIDTSKCTLMNEMFSGCSSLVTISPIDLSKALYTNKMLYNCSALAAMTSLDMSNVVDASYMYRGCTNIAHIEQLYTPKVTNMDYMIYACYNLRSVYFDMSGVADVNDFMDYCYNLRVCLIKNLKTSVRLIHSPFVEKESLIYMIENAAPTKAITITLSRDLYNKYKADPDVVAALANQPLVSLTYL